MKSRTQQHQYQNGFDDMLRSRGVKLQKGQRIIDRLVTQNYGKIVKNNPEKKYTRQNPDIDSLEHYSQSQFSSGCKSSMVKTPARALPRIQIRKRSVKSKQKQEEFSLQDQNSILAQRARLFVNRLKKRKQYDEGRAMVRRKQQQKMRLKKMKSEMYSQQNQRGSSSMQKYNKMIENILYHEQRISKRLKKSLSRYKKSNVRCSTQGSNYLDEDKQVSRSATFANEVDSQDKDSRTPILKILRKRVAKLSNMIDSLQM